ncbi:MAG: transporter ATP-binding protein [Thermomicrobiales bacterium]|nr:transporter ATP-binding protein [Thermomicrobiales bacterium]
MTMPVAAAQQPIVGARQKEPLVRIEGVTKRFNETTALEAVDLDIADGEMMIFLGPSGSGKTTLLRIIAGLESATDGRIILAGRDVTDLPPEQRNVSMVSRTSPFPWRLSADEARRRSANRWKRRRRCSASATCSIGALAS